jgi:UDP-N-acetylmuramoyl-tripeptide--D-alanyl-D-alanine ligase
MDGGLPKQNIFFLSDSTEGIDYLKTHFKKGEWVLVKGSRRMKMEKIVAQICEAFGGEKISGNNNQTVH